MQRTREWLKMATKDDDEEDDGVEDDDDSDTTDDQQTAEPDGAKDLAQEMGSIDEKMVKPEITQPSWNGSVVPLR